MSRELWRICGEALLWGVVRLEEEFRRAPPLKKPEKA